MGNPASSLRPVAFRPRLTAGLAFSVTLKPLAEFPIYRLDINDYPPYVKISEQ